ncbi:MAG: flavin reductase family protein [Acidimicrobiales bacterium]|jgi:flavin reductase (DIM6/NTAB) family NADH-FMN oxidoreductase RutF
MPLVDSGIGPYPQGRDREEYDRLRRRVLWSLPTGLFVVGSRAGAQRNMMTCNWVMQVATAPKLVAVAVEQDSVTRRLIEQGGSFSVSVLPRSARAVVRRFVKPTHSVELDGVGSAVSLQGEPVREVAGGLPCLAVARSWLACDVRHLLRWDGDGTAGVASHVLFVGEVVDAGETDTGGADDDPSEAGGPGVLRMEDTRMNYGG